MKIIKWVSLVVLLFPVAALAFFKPSRILAPESFGVRCSEQNICVDDIAKYPEAVELYRTSKQYLETRWGLVIGEPKLIFCSTGLCADRFGLGGRAAYALGTFGVVVAPRGWKDRYVEHELIHYWQAENFGNLTLLSGKKWLIEGMAYALSNDPREKLTEPFESYRRSFEEWFQRNSHEPLRQAVKREL